ncbi:MAG: site-specific DNA-methyltransferase, partial [Nanoarchaeota archaeon]|nr:site-specific DNA-methyltransferase [Nanoarchaeota archaeon]
MDDKEERYRFTWHGKTQARRLAQTPSTGTLRPCKEESINWDATENLFIEGDNLEVLKLLQKSYHKEIKMIYIDPPYNTGKDFVYKDDFRDNIKNYKELTGQVDGAGKTLSTNSETSGRYHTDWLNMMYPRLKLARNLLTQDGLIFISIDDNEQENLKRICNEIFGEDNFISVLVWKKKYTGGKHTKGYVDMHEYIIVYAKNAETVSEISIDRPEEEKEKFTEQDEFEKERGKYYTRPLKSNLEERKTLVYPLKMPDGSILETQWLVGKERFDREFDEKRIIFKQKRNGEWQVYKKYYENDSGGTVKPPSLIERFPNTEAKYELKKLFQINEGRDNVFYTVKPTGLLKFLFSCMSGNKGIVLDFFSGVSSTAHAVISKNIEDNGSFKFIMVQLPEPCDKESEEYKSGYKTIADIGKERIRRVIKNIEKEKDETLFKDKKLDLGFKVFKLDSSNIATWDPDFDNVQQDLLKAVDNIKADRKEEDVLYEILLKYGLDLTVPIEGIKI